MARSLRSKLKIKMKPVASCLRQNKKLKFFNMNKSLIVANWKCNPTSKVEAFNLFKAANDAIEDAKSVEVVICPPYVQISDIRHQMPEKGGLIKLGAQDCFWEQKGAYTGEVSPAMLKDMGCEYVIVGHSERRQYFNESDEIVNKKLKAASDGKLKPIVCIGEKEEEKEIVKEILQKQLGECLRDLSASQAAKIVIAYEPVWAIGTGNFCLPEDAFSACLIIKRFLMNLFGKNTADNIRILYGGSVDGKNAAQYVKEAKMDGLLVGGASLNGGEFGKIISSIATISNF